MKAFFISTVTITVALIFFSTPSFAETDLTSVDIEGFRLGMTMDEVKKAYPKIRFREIKPDGKNIMGYNAATKGVSLSFTNKELGSVIFSIQKAEMHSNKQDSFPVFQKLKEKYGPPDYSGRQMFSIQACWGRCFGDYQRLEFRMKTGSLRGKNFPMTLTLSDPEVSKQNRRMFLKAEKATRK